MKSENEPELTKPKGVLLPRCHFCGEVPPGGIRGGIKVKKAFICIKCEEEIVSLQVGAPGYSELLEKLKRVLK
ncbi:MAG TPA: sigma factor G inhibitor Gin [Syntrophomonadaceae bacterium]|nr:sigma factor G inhibitor Gin [Syntrophomonadaceae bacterium]